MKKVYILLACVLLLPKLVRAQYYIELNKENTFHYKNSYLIDIPISLLRGNLFIQDPKQLIPTRVYSNIYLNDRTNRLDTIFISRISQIGKSGLKRGILQKNVIPYFVREDYMNAPTDTLGDADNRFASYKALSKSSLLFDQKFVIIYYEDSYGSDISSETSHRRKTSLHDFIDAFEKKHHVKVGKIFSTSLGNEGDVEIYFTLSGLNSKLKLQFIRERELSLSPRDSKKDKYYSLKIYTPYMMDISGYQIRVE